ncbi:hypothetical protein SK069_17470 [Patulibacter brassicae]|jgi:hypothetical protein|uniref:Uncharacterized protein n=1 Tax=Patulibacter brassicae TaxID=1705717 RepID=A0ABU4VPX6_9ACTN|nr:hypothetical protein [Patulibacter brassicae]MDX8153392.1 hypothetical protein [Patulibacter brassicae]
MSAPLAHVGGLHAVLYLSPVLFVAGGLWMAGRHLPEEEPFEPDDDEPTD